jgi:release factor glutamine methyltransferase
MTRHDVVVTLRAAGCVYAEEEADVLAAAAASAADLDRMLRRRAAGEPLEHVVGWAEFCGLRIAVEPGVFVPRRRTELVVEVAARLSAGAPVVVDLCCGSGAVGAALAARLPGAVVHAADSDPVAVSCARRNLAVVRGHVHCGDLYDALPPDLRGRVDLLVANAPYVPSGDLALMPAEARLHEPAHALVGGVDGLDVHRRIAAEAPHWLSPAGHVVIETSRRQAAGTEAALIDAGLVATIEYDDNLGATVAIGSPGRP